MKKKILKFIKDSAYKFGYSIIGNWQLKDLELSIHTRDLFSLLNIECVLDVGANKGQYRDFLRNEIGFEGQIFSFEPVSHLAKNLEERAKGDLKWQIFKIALGSKNGNFSININKGDTLHSFLDSAKSQPDSRWFENNKVLGKEDVLVKTLDDFIKEISFKIPLNKTFIKLDTQGFDLDVLEGGKNSLIEIAALQTEISILPIYENMPDYRQTIDILNANNFQITGLIPVTWDKWLRLIEMDCLAINYGLIEKLKIRGETKS